jgi:ribose transport system substrate-binding protein
MPLSLGQVLHNRYRIVKLIGQGGFGAVYRAWDTALNQPCAVKENLDTSPEAQRQFRREATLLAGLRHPNLPRVIDHFLIPGQGQYLVMDFVEGEDLQEMLDKRGPLPETKVLAWAGQVCDALEYLHRQNVIHRDIKPQNIIVTTAGQAMLVDFGISKVYDPQLQTTTGARAVTSGYSPWEQYSAGHTDARSDVYALGATLYTLLTGQVPPPSVDLLGGSVLLTLPRQLKSAISANTERAVLRAMAQQPDQRFQSVAELRQALCGPAVANGKPPALRARLVTGVVGLLLLGVLGGVLLAGGLRGPATPTPSPTLIAQAIVTPSPTAVPRPTNTPTPTDTPVPPTDTPTSTVTPIPPASTSIPTDTPILQTSTPVPTLAPPIPTPTFTHAPKPTPKPRPSYKIGFLAGVQDPFYFTMERGARQAATELGVEVIAQYPDSWNAAVQTPMLNAMVARGDLDFLFLAPVDKEAMAAPLGKAYGAGLPLLTVDTYLGDGDYAKGPVTFPLSYIGSDNVEGGRIGCTALAEAIGGKGKVYIQNVVPGLSTIDQREEGCKEAFAKYPDITLVGVDYNDGDPAKAQTQAVLQREPELAGVFGTNAYGAQGAGQAVINAGLSGKVKVVAFDATEFAIEKLRDKTVDLVIAQKPFDMGYLAVQKAVAYLDGVTSIPKRITTGYEIITRDNVDDPNVARFIYTK